MLLTLTFERERTSEMCLAMEGCEFIYDPVRQSERIQIVKLLTFIKLCDSAF